MTATAFMARAKACNGRTEVPYAETATLLQAALTAMIARGDNTVLDALDAIARGRPPVRAARSIDGRRCRL